VNPLYRALLICIALVSGTLPFDPPLHAQTPISIHAADGGVVVADLYGSGQHAVVLAHGGRFDRTSWRELAHLLAKRGFRVVAIDFRAAVEARKGHEPPCLYDEHCLARDVLAALTYLRQSGSWNVALVGASLGGGAVAQASVEARPHTISKLVLLAHMPIEHPEKMQGRKLFIVARNDLGSGDVPRLPEIRSQYDKAPGPKKLVVLEGSAHAQFLFATDQGERLTNEIVQFLEQR
jgi:pimeloyl-ACP methyl ester carboxylesterase